MKCEAPVDLGKAQKEVRVCVKVETRNGIHTREGGKEMREQCRRRCLSRFECEGMNGRKATKCAGGASHDPAQTGPAMYGGGTQRTHRSSRLFPSMILLRTTSSPPPPAKPTSLYSPATCCVPHTHRYIHIMKPDHRNLAHKIVASQVGPPAPKATVIKASAKSRPHIH